MKTITKLATATVLALSAAAPAFAFEPLAQTLLERNTYLYTADARPIAQHQQDFQVRAHRGTDAMAQAPVSEEHNGQYYNDRNVQ
jgi:hypothetical protein